MKRLFPFSYRKPFFTAICLVLSVALLASLYAWWCVGKYPDKLWLHRANSIEKWQQMADLYPNAEIDVIIRPDQTLDVTHDDSISYHLSVDAYIAYMANRGGKLWLDIKNLTPVSAPAFRHRLDSMLARYGVDRGRLIIESDNAEALRYLTRQGRYFTSYYIRYPDPARLSTIEVDRAIGHLRRLADSGDICALSFPIYWYDTIHSRLNRNIPLLTWDHHTRQWTFLLLPWKRALLNDPQLKVILLKRKGSFHR